MLVTVLLVFVLVFMLVMAVPVVVVSGVELEPSPFPERPAHKAGRVGQNDNARVGSERARRVKHSDFKRFIDGEHQPRRLDHRGDRRPQIEIVLVPGRVDCQSRLAGAGHYGFDKRMHRQNRSDDAGHMLRRGGLDGGAAEKRCEKNGARAVRGRPERPRPPGILRRRFSAGCRRRGRQ